MPVRIPARLPRPVHVTWNDAHHLALGEWVDDLDAIPIGVPAETVAWLVTVREEHLVLAHSHDAENRVGRVRCWTGTFLVPLSAVESLTPLEPAVVARRRT